MRTILPMSKKEKKPNISNPKYWYYYYIGECPVCGRDQSSKERRYGPKPKSINKRVEYLSNHATYDYCMER